MEVQKLASLKQRTDDWLHDRQYWLTEQTPKRIGLTLIFGMALYLSQNFIYKYFNMGDSLVLQIMNVVLPLSLSLSAVYAILSTYPKKPTQADVDMDVLLRKTVGMDSTVNGEHE